MNSNLGPLPGRAFPPCTAIQSHTSHFVNHFHTSLPLKSAYNPRIILTYRAAAVDWCPLLDMLELALKLHVSEAEDRAEAEWHKVVGAARGGTPAGQLGYVARLMERARSRGIGIESFYITNAERRVSEQPVVLGRFSP